jgi:hypothetical protein
MTRNDGAAARPYVELNVSSDTYWEQDTEERIVATASDEDAAGEPIDLVDDVSRHLSTRSWRCPTRSCWRGAIGALVQVEATKQIHRIAQQLIAARASTPPRTHRQISFGPTLTVRNLRIPKSVP